MKKNLLKNMTAAIAALFIALFALPQTAQAQSVTIMGQKYDKSTVLNISGGGSITWNQENTTVTLRNVVLDGITTPLIMVSTGDGIEELKVVLEGENTVTATNFIFRWDSCNMTIQGTGSLKASTTSNIAIYKINPSPSTLTIRNCSLDIQGAMKSISGYSNGADTEVLSLVVDNATLKVKGATGGWGWKESGITYLEAYELKGCHIETPGVKFGKRNNFSYYELLGEDNDVYIGEVSIVPDASAGITQPEAYVVEAGSTLYFYYDTNKAERTSTVYGIDDKQADGQGLPAWSGTAGGTANTRITKVVFNSSFKDYRPTSTKGWFYICKNIETIEGLSNLNTEQVTNMSQMFTGCKSLTSLDLSNFNTSNVTAMLRMFYQCSALTTLDVSNFNTAKVTDMRGMFGLCSAMTTIYCNDDWNSGTVTKSSDMFRDCKKLKGAVAYDETKTDVRMANPTTGYFTKKDPSGIDAATVDTPAARRGIYTLNGVRLNTSPDNLPAGIYVIDGRKVVKR